MEKFVLRVEAFGVEVLSAEFSGEDKGAVHNRGEVCVIGNGLQMQAHGKLHIHPIAIFPVAINFCVAGGCELLVGLEGLAIDREADVFGPIRNADLQAERHGRF